MKKSIVWIVLLAMVIAPMLSLTGCHKDECEGSLKTNAEFRTYNELYYYDKEKGETIQKIKQVEEDTFMLSQVTFEALDQNALSYEWTIGSDPRKRTEKKFTLTFNDPGVMSENPLPIKLKITKEPDIKCFPSDKGIDSVTNYIYFLPYNEWPVYGKYVGSDNTNPDAKYTIEIFAGYRNGYFTGDSLKNLPNKCSKLPVRLGSETAFEFTIYYTELVINNQIYPVPDCNFREYDKHIGYLKPDRKTIVIEYEFVDKTQLDASLQKRIFTGTRQ